MPTHLQIAYGSFCVTKTALGRCKRDHMASKLKIFTIWSFTEKVASPVLKHEWQVTWNLTMLMGFHIFHIVEDKTSESTKEQYLLTWPWAHQLGILESHMGCMLPQGLNEEEELKSLGVHPKSTSATKLFCHQGLSKQRRKIKRKNKAGSLVSFYLNHVWLLRLFDDTLIIHVLLLHDEWQQQNIKRTTPFGSFLNEISKKRNKID